MENMFIVKELIANIQQYGNSKVYLKELSNHRTNEFLKFLVDEKGELTISRNLEVFSKECQNTESIEIGKYAEEDLPMIIAKIVLSSFYKNRVIVTKVETSISHDTDMVVKKLYQIVYAMLQLSNADLTRWVLSTKNGIENQLINNASKNVTPEEVNLEQATENIETMVKEVWFRLRNVEAIWRKTITSTSEEKFKIACNQWDDLYTDHVIPEFSITNRSRK